MFELLQSLDEFRNLFKTFEGQFVNVTSKSGEQIVWTKKHMMQRVKKKWIFFTFNISQPIVCLYLPPTPYLSQAKFKLHFGINILYVGLVR